MELDLPDLRLRKLCLSTETNYVYLPLAAAAIVGTYSDTSANEDNSFRNHIR